MRDEVDLFRRRGYHVNIRLEQVALFLENAKVNRAMYAQKSCDWPACRVGIDGTPVCAKNPIRVAEVMESLKLAK